MTYLVTVALLVIPFLLMRHGFQSLGIMITRADISLGVAALSFLIGWLLGSLLGVEA